MTFGIKLLQFTKPIVGTPPVNQVSASLGFAPKAAISFHCNGNNTSSTTSYSEHIGSGIGFSDGTNHRCKASVSLDNSGSSVAKHVNRNSFIAIIDSAAINDEADVSFQSDTITLSWNPRSANAAEVFVLVLGGSDITNCTVGDFACPTVAGNQTTTGTSFTPDCELYIQSGTSTNDSAITNATHMSLGFAVSASKQVAMSSDSEDGRASMDTVSWANTTKCIATMDLQNSDQENFDGTLSAFTSTGRTITWGAAITNSASRKVYFMAIKGANIDVGSFNVTAGTGDFNAVTTTSFTPSGWLFVANGLNASGATVVPNNRWAIGAATSSSERACISTHDALGTTSINTKIHQTTRCMQIHTAAVTAASSVTELELDFVSNNSNGCTLNRVTNTTTLGNELVEWIAFGPSAAAGNAIERALTTESTSMSESLAELAAKTRTRTETAIAIAETRSRLSSKLRPVTVQTITLSENIIRVKGKVKTLAAETITIGAGSIARLLAKIRIGSSDTTAIAEARNRLAAKTRALATQSTVLSESVQRIKGKIKSLATETVIIGAGAAARLSSKIQAIALQTVSLTDNRIRLKGSIRTIATQTVTLSDNLARTIVRQVIRALATQTVTLSESLTRLKISQRIILQTIVLTDARNRLAVKLRGLALQTIALSESRARIKGALKTISQTTILTENIVRRTAKLRVLAAQTIAITENVTRQIIGGAEEIVRALSDTILLSHSIARLKAAQRISSDSISKAETLARIRGITKTISQTVILSDTRTRIKSALKTTSQTVLSSDSINKQMTKIRLLVQTTVIAENVAQETLGNLVRSLVETITSSDSIARRTVKLVILDQFVTIVGQTSRISTKLRTIPPQTITLSDSITAELNVLIKNVVKIIGQITAVTDYLKLEVVKRSQRFRRILQPSQRRHISNHPAWFLGTRGMHNDYEEYSV